MVLSSCILNNYMYRSESLAKAVVRLHMNLYYSASIYYHIRKQLRSHNVINFIMASELTCLVQSIQYYRIWEFWREVAKYNRTMLFNIKLYITIFCCCWGGCGSRQM